MRGLIARLLAGQAPAPAPSIIDAGIAQRRAERLSRPERNEAKRFARAAGKVEQLRREIAMQHVRF
jgi:hypothetical protein